LQARFKRLPVCIFYDGYRKVAAALRRSSAG
jgi:hypothetical protein